MFTKIFEIGNQSIKIETGLIAKQADASVLVDIEGTVALATLVAAKNLVSPKLPIKPVSTMPVKGTAKLAKKIGTDNKNILFFEIFVG